MNKILAAGNMLQLCIRN